MDIVSFIHSIYSTQNQLDLLKLLQTMNSHTGLQRSMFQIFSPGVTRPDCFIVEGITKDEYQPYFDEYHKHNIWVESAIQEGKMLGVTTGLELLPREEYDASIWFNEFIKPSGIYDVLTNRYLNDDKKLCFFSTFSSTEKPDFTEDQIRFFKSASPHLSRLTINLARTEKAELGRDFFNAQSEHQQHAYLLLDKWKRIMACSVGAEKILDNNSGIRVCNNVFSVVEKNANQQFEENFQKANAILSDESVQTQPVKVPRTRGLKPIILQMSPFIWREETLLPSNIYTCVTIYHPDDEIQEITKSAAMLLYGLTPAESKIADLLTQGKEMQDIAELLSISKYTARHHLKSIFSKTETNRQSALVLKLMKTAVR